MARALSKLILRDLRSAREVEPLSGDAGAEFLMQTYSDMLEPTQFGKDQAIGFPQEVLYKRMIWANSGPVSVNVASTVVAQSFGLIGCLIMWAYTLHRMGQSLGHMVTIEDLAKAFPKGFPTERAQAEIWDAQKGSANNLPGDNLIDLKEMWASQGLEV